MKARMSLLIDKELKQKIGIKAVLEGKRISTVVEELIRLGLEQVEKEEKKSGV